MLASILLGNNDSNQNELFDIDPLIFHKLSQKFDEAIVFTELKQKMGIQDISPQSETYKDLMRYLKTIFVYPSTQKAQFHREANRLGNFDVQKVNNDLKRSVDKVNKLVNEIKNCQCCGLVKQEEELKMCSNSFREVASVGISTYMFYRTMVSLSCFLILALLVFGIFAFGSNIGTAVLWNSKGIKEEFSSSLMISLGSKIYLAIYDTSADKDLLIAQVWLGLAMVVSFIFAYVLMERIQVTKVRKVEILNKSASDFTVVVMGVPLDVTKSEIQAEIKKLLNDSDKDTNNQQANESKFQFQKNHLVSKINVGIPKDRKSIEKHKISQEKTAQILEEQKKYKEKILSWIMELTENTQFVTPQQTRNKIQKDLINFRNKNKISDNNLILSMMSLGSKISSKSIKKILLKESLKADEMGNKIISNELIKHDQITKVIKTDAFVTFESRKVKQKLLTLMQNTVLDKFLKYLTLDLYQKKVPITLHGQTYNVRIEQASQPEDVIWDNIGIKPKQLFIRKCVTFFITFIILGASFVTVYGLSTVQYHNQDNRYISFLISLCLSIFNFIILFTLRILTTYELSLTQTDYQSSLAVKAIIAQLVNIIIIPILVNRFLKNHNYLYQKSGLAEDVFLLGITNCFLGPIMKIFNVSYIYMKYFAVWYNERPKMKFYLSQKELNRVYELEEFENGIEYVYIITLYLFTCFFMSLQPIIIVFAICGYVMNYWAQKYCLFHRCKRPVPGTRILYDTMVQFIYAGGLFYSVGSLCFINLIPEDVFQNKINPALLANLISVGVSVFSLFIPFSFLYELIFGDSNSYSEENDQLFSQDRVFLLSEYDRTNPATRDVAVGEYISFVNEKKKEIKNRSKKQKAQFLQIFSRQARNIHNQNFEQLNPLNFIDFSAQTFNELPEIPPNIILNYLLADITKVINKSNDQRMYEENVPKNQGIDACEIVLQFSQIIKKERPELKKQQFQQEQPSLKFLFDLPQ